MSALGPANRDDRDRNFWHSSLAMLELLTSAIRGQGHQAHYFVAKPSAAIDVPRMKKHAAREAACLDRSSQTVSLRGRRASSISFGRARWLRWQLKHRCLLTLT